MLSRGFVNAHLRYGTKPLMATFRRHSVLRRIAGLYSKVMFRPSRDMTFVPDQLHSETAAVDCVWCSMGAQRDDKAILYLHGGGFTLGDAQSHGAMVARLAGEVGGSAAMVMYRLAPEHPYPAAIDDAQIAYQGLLARGYRGEDIILMGDSAGGGLIFTLLLRLQRLNLPRPAICVAISPFVDLTLSGASFSQNIQSDSMLPIRWITRSRDAYVGQADATLPDVSPLFGSFENPPPCFIVYAAEELLASDSHAMAETLRASGGAVTSVVENNLPHVWTFYHGKFAPADKTIGQIGEFVKQHL